jgi:hypothetical protein
MWTTRRSLIASAFRQHLHCSSPLSQHQLPIPLRTLPACIPTTKSLIPSAGPCLFIAYRELGTHSYSSSPSALQLYTSRSYIAVSSARVPHQRNDFPVLSPALIPFSSTHVVSLASPATSSHSAYSSTSRSTRNISLRVPHQRVSPRLRSYPQH